MGLFRQRVTRPMPAGAEIFTRKDERFARWQDRCGKVKTAKLTADGSRIATHSATWSARYRDADDIVREVSTGCRDKTAAQTKLAELIQTAERVRIGAISRTDAEVANWQAVAMVDHIRDYVADLRDRGVNADRVKTSETYLLGDAEECGFRHLRDLSSDALRRWLRSDADMSAGTYNWHAALWVAFGWWLTGRRISGKRQSQTGEKRLAENPFNGFGKRSEGDDRRRIARALSVDEMRRLLEQARRRPVEDALRVSRGPNRGTMTAKLTPERRQRLERLGLERSLIYKTAILTGLRLNELRTLRVGDLSFGDVPFVALRASNEKNRKGSTIPLRDDLAENLKQWVIGKAAGDLVLNVPAGLLRILNRDLVGAGIDKIDERGRRVHLHALRMSTATHLSAAGVSPRTAQALMRHSDIKLTMATYTDERLLNSAGAVALLPDLPIGATDDKTQTEATSDGRKAARTVTPFVTPEASKRGQNESFSGKIGKDCRDPSNSHKCEKPGEKRGFSEWSRRESNPRPLHCERTGDAAEVSQITGRNASAAESLPQLLPLNADLPRFAEALRDLLDADQRRRLAVELLRE